MLLRMRRSDPKTSASTFRGGCGELQARPNGRIKNERGAPMFADTGNCC